jgi:NADH-quinone oxidoreductase subunit A
MSGMETSIGIVAYLALFAAVGIIFLFVNLLVGRFLRPSNPHPEKLEIYECGEPTIGSSYVQFDLRFYVVALVFIVFDVEVAFLFPWATVFGKSVNLSDHRFEVAAMSKSGVVKLTPAATALYREMGISAPSVPAAANGQPYADSNSAADSIKAGAHRFALFSAAAMGVFFVVLLIGFAYEWKSGAFDWVRAVAHERNQQETPSRIPLDPIMEEDLASV